MVGYQFLGAVLGILCVGILYLGVMLAYFSIKKKYPNAKYWVEVTVISIVLFFSIAVKMIILSISISAQEANVSLAYGLANVLHSIYSGFGGLTFEGLQEPTLINGVVLSCLYTGTSVLASLVFFSVITAKANYEIFCRVRLFFTSKKHKNIYLFTAVTEDALTLANSIREKDQEGIIIFSGNELEAFDRKNDLHREIMAKGYLYWSFYKSTTKSLIKKLRLFAYNNLFEEGVNKETQIEYKKVHVFAVSNNAKLSGLESINNAIVFEEIKALITEHSSSKTFKKHPLPIVSFYILTDSTVNYQAYTAELKKTINTSVKEESLKEIFEYCFQINVINDAVLAGKDLAIKRREEFSKNGGTLLLEDPKPYDKSNEYRVMVLGFGQTGQQAMKSLFINTAYVDGDGKPTKFIADVYDRDSSKFGLFASTHPSFITKERKISTQPYQVTGKENSEILLRAYDYLDANKKDSFQTEIDAYMGFPIVAFHGASAFGLSFSKYIDKISGVDETAKSLYKAFIVTFGNDEDNLSFANSLIDDIKHEYNAYGSDNKIKQTIYVNIRNSQNEHRLNWTEEDKKRFEFLKVITFGSQNEIYSYDSIIEEDGARIAHLGYSWVYNKKAELTKLNNVFIQNPAPKTDEEIDLRSIYEKINVASTIDNMKAWFKSSVFDKESSKAVSIFKYYYTLRLKAKVTTSDTILNLSQIEHTRWARFHFSHGFIYANYTDDDKDEKDYRKSIKEHNCLKPFKDLTNQINDAINIVISCKEEKTANTEKSRKTKLWTRKI